MQINTTTLTMKAYHKLEQYIYCNCQLSQVTPGHALFVSVCILMRPLLELATEPLQLTATYHRNCWTWECYTCIATNWMGIHVTCCMAKIVPSLSSLEDLSLGDNPIESGGTVELIKALCGSGVKQLWLWETGVGVLDCEALCQLRNQATSSPSHWCKPLVLGECNQHHHWTQNNFLTKLNISNSHFSMANVDSLASILKTAPSAHYQSCTCKTATSAVKVQWNWQLHFA